MKCLIFIFTLCSIGTCDDVQGETDIDPAQSDYDTVLQPEDNQPEESGEKDESGGGVENNSADESSSSSQGESSSDKEDKSMPIDKETLKLFINELEAGDMADLIGQNQHIRQSSEYHDLGRRSKSQALKNNVEEDPDYLTPEKAPPELVLLVAKESRLLRAGKDNDLNDFDQNKILRSGNYWDGVWKEEVIPKSAMRSATQEKQLGSIKAKINPGTEFYKVVSRMKKISPKLLYIINRK